MHFNSIFYLQVKQIMEEAVTKKFVHEDSSHIIALCSKYTLLCLLSSPSLCRSLSVSVSLWLFVFHPTTLSLPLTHTVSNVALQQVKYCCSVPKGPDLTSEFP